MKDVIEIIKNQNNESIISLLKRSTLKEFINKVLVSNNYDFFILENKKINGYIILKKPTIDSTNGVYKISYIVDLIVSLNFKVYLNLIIKYFGLDKILFNSFQKKIYYNSINISYLGINKKLQSKGYGKKLLKFAIKKTKFKSKYITVETINSKASKFYLEKCKFRLLSKKFQLFNLVNVFFAKKN